VIKLINVVIKVINTVRVFKSLNFNWRNIFLLRQQPIQSKEISCSMETSPSGHWAHKTNKIQRIKKSAESPNYCVYNGNNLGYFKRRKHFFLWTFCILDFLVSLIIHVSFINVDAIEVCNWTMTQNDSVKAVSCR
jgi:hypothetical protein